MKFTSMTGLACAMALGLASGSALAIGTGGTITYTDSSGANPRTDPPHAGGYVVHTFTNSGTLTIPFAASAEYLVVAGGGAGGMRHGGGGGAGGLLAGSTNLAAQSYTITVGAGGAPANPSSADDLKAGNPGYNSVFGAITAIGGGGGRTYSGTYTGAGGSGGGGAGSQNTAGGTGTSGQGYAGGSGSATASGSGGGGAVEAGKAGNPNGGNGGNGVLSSISGVATYYAGGGGGGGDVAKTGGVGGLGGGGHGGDNGLDTSQTAGTNGTGGGGGGCRSNTPTLPGSAGGSGIVIVRYAYVDGPLISTLDPANNATGIAVSSSLVVTFDRDVQKATGNIVIKRSTDNSVIQTIDVTSGQVTVSGAAATIVPATLASGTQYYVQFPAGTFTATADSSLAMGIMDMTTWRFTTAGSPTLVSIVDDKSGGPIIMGQMVTYTVTFSEDMDASTVAASRFSNAGDATITIGIVTETTSTSGIFIVPVTTTGTGTLQLQINAGAVLWDPLGNALDTSSALLDDTTIVVDADTIPPTPNPLTWASAPAATGTSIAMTATTATDISGVEYFFECTAGGGPSSAWQNSATYTATGLTAAKSYTYRVRARDKSVAQNATGYSDAVSVFTDQVGTFSSSATAPTVEGPDVASFGTRSGSDKWYNDGKGNSASAAKGQTFTTGSKPVLFKAITYKCDGANMKAASIATPTSYTVRLGTVSGTTFTPIAKATVSQTANSVAGGYMTWAFATPVLLAANTTYAADVAMTIAGIAWNSGIPYLEISGDVYAGGQFYNSGVNGVPANPITFTSGNDRVFHIDMDLTPPQGTLMLVW